jgi:hypothetical protein
MKKTHFWALGRFACGLESEALGTTFAHAVSCGLCKKQRGFVEKFAREEREIEESRRALGFAEFEGNGL